MRVPPTTSTTFLATLVAALSCGPSFAAIVINEIHYAPPDKTIPEEFVELYNSGPAAVDLSNWYFANGISYVIPAGTVLAAGEYLVVAQDPATLTDLFGAIPVVGPYSGRLSNQGESLVLRNSSGIREDTVDYRRGFPWPTAGGSAGYSIELIRPELDNDLGGSWRLSNPTIQSADDLVRPGELWRYRKGTSEPSNPVTAWRLASFNDAGWSAGPTSIGYGEGFITTVLDDMQDNYSTVYLRKSFDVDDPNAVGNLVLEVLFDDGFNAWINGVHVAGSNLPATEMGFDDTASSAIEDLEFNAFPLPRPRDFLVAGTNVLAVQLHNASLSGSSDAFIDVRLTESAGAAAGPTPGARNSVFSSNSSPHLRQLEHSPQEPTSSDPVLVTIKATDDEGLVDSVFLEYQLVDPGAYIEIDDPEYASDWTAVDMNDDGDDGDLLAGDDTWSVLLPASMHLHRRLVRYRLTAVDVRGNASRAPYADDPVPNFAYFVYDGAPAWRGAIEPGSANATRRTVVDYSPDVMNRLPIYHLIARRSAVEDATWISKYGGDNYRWRGTLVAHGRVYDHVRYRARGGVWRYAMGKNMWKFDFARGHSFQALDDFGREYATRWDKLNFSAVIQQGDYRHRGEQGLFESTGFKMFNLTGVEAPKTHFVTFRIVDEAGEAGASQYDGDLWGLYLVVEQMDGRFLDEHGLPDGNLYKMEGGSGTLNNQGPTAATNRSDLNSFLNTYQNSTPSDQWWRDNLDLDRYYSYRAIVEGIHHYDIAGGKNYFYYLNPETDIWSVLPWDLDLTWADNMFGSGNEPFKSRVLSRAMFSVEYKNRMREIRDLFYNDNQAYELIDEFAAMVDDPGGAPSIVDVDRAMWDYNPIMVNSSIVNTGKAGHGRFYERSPTRDFPGMARLMKNYVTSRGQWIDSVIATDAAIPSQPTISTTAPPGFPIDAITLSTSSFSDPQGNNTFGGMEWRVAEVAAPSAPAYDPTNPRPFEIETVWQSGELAFFQGLVEIPPDVLAVGHRYRARVRMKDNTSRWSHWSEPLEFVAGEPTAPVPQQRYLRITEIMYHPTDGSDFEFVEILNTGPAGVDLRPIAFTEGIRFDFAAGDVALLGAGQYVLVVNNLHAFSTVHDVSGLDIAGEYSGRLDNEGDRIVLTYGQNLTIHDFTYDDDWYPSTDGGGHSLVHVDPEGPIASWNEPAGWTSSVHPGGSPGATDGGPPPGGRQLPGDSNQDGALDLADGVSLLARLFGGGGGPLPCEGAIDEAGNRTLLDIDQNNLINLSDVVFLLNFLFKKGPPPASGTFCIRIDGCPSACAF